MSASNNCAFIGRCGRDPEMAYSPSGLAITKFSMAVDKFSTANGEKRKTTMWLNIVCFAKTAEFVNQFFHKGKPVAVVGELSVTEYQPKDTTQPKQKWIEIIASAVDFVPSDTSSRQPVQEYDTLTDMPGDEREL